MERIIILGAGSGIGACVARRLARDGVSLLLHTGSNREGLEHVAAACRDAGARVDQVVGASGDDATFEPISAWLASTDLTALVFAAGYAKLGSIAETPPQALETAFHDMPNAFLRIVKLAAPRLRDRRGRIVCVSAFGAHRTKTHQFLPTAPAKAALEALVKLFAAQLAPRGITCNAVVPGFIAKEAKSPSALTSAQWQEVMAGIPMGRLGDPDEVAALIAFLVSASASYMTGEVLHVNGGLTL